MHTFAVYEQDRIDFLLSDPRPAFPGRLLPRMRLDNDSMGWLGMGLPPS